MLGKLLIKKKILKILLQNLNHAAEATYCIQIQYDYISCYMDPKLISLPVWAGYAGKPIDQLFVWLPSKWIR